MSQKQFSAATTAGTPAPAAPRRPGRAAHSLRSLARRGPAVITRTGPGITRKAAGIGFALAVTAGTAAALTAAAPSAFAVTCSSSGTSSSLNEHFQPTGGTIWRIPAGCGNSKGLSTIKLTKAASGDSYMGLLFSTSTLTWVDCHGGQFQPWKGSTLILCTDVEAGTQFAVIQGSTTHHNVSVSYNPAPNTAG